jgi:hypothetical protein
MERQEEINKWGYRRAQLLTQSKIYIRKIPKTDRRRVSLSNRANRAVRVDGIVLLTFMKFAETKRGQETYLLSPVIQEQ